MSSFNRVLLGGRSVSGNSEAPRSRRGNTEQANTYWSGIGVTQTKVNAVELLVIAGGGGCSMGGAGAGGYREFSSVPVSAGTTYTITIGAGGNGSGEQNTNAASGNPSSALGYSASGGGRSGPVYTAGTAGGSGGGAGSSNGGQVYAGGGAGNAGSYSPVECYAGGANTFSEAGGGGGAGAVGVATVGGVGLASSITGASVTRARGGYVNASQGASGANTGNGGSWNGTTNVADAVNSGGSGVVIIAYPQTFFPAASTTGSPTYSGTSRNGYHVYTFTGNVSITF
jgi:hypothetical protein